MGRVMQARWSEVPLPEDWGTSGISVDRCAMPKSVEAFERIITRTARRMGKAFRRKQSRKRPNQQPTGWAA
jgi:hypothetical protein